MATRRSEDEDEVCSDLLNMISTANIKTASQPRTPATDYRRSSISLGMYNLPSMAAGPPLAISGDGLCSSCLIPRLACLMGWKLRGSGLMVVGGHERRPLCERTVLSAATPVVISAGNSRSSASRAGLRGQGGLKHAPFHPCPIAWRAPNGLTEQPRLEAVPAKLYFELLGTWQPKQGGDGGAVRQRDSRSWGRKILTTRPEWGGIDLEGNLRPQS